MRRVNLLLYLFLLFSLQGYGQTFNKQDARITELEPQFNKLLHTWHAAGFAVAVVQKDKVIYAQGFGYRDYEKKLPVTPSTIFAIGSCTKAFTAGMMGTLRQEGKVDFEQPVRRFMPELVFSSDDLNDHVTLRDMMSHRTGLPRYDVSWYYFAASSRDSMLDRIRYMWPAAPLRTTFIYNNFMFLAQGLVAEKVTGKKWEENIQTRFLDKLEMTHTNLSVNVLIQQPEAATGYGVIKDSTINKLDYRNIDIIAPAGSINSTVLDMANWVTMWIQGGKFKGKEILPEVYINEAIGMQMPMGTGLPGKQHPDVFSNGYGFGWMLHSYRGHYQVEHGGNIDGFTANTCFYPTDSIGIIVLSNQSASQIPELVRNMISDRLLGLKQEKWSEELYKKLYSGRAGPKKDSVQPEVKGAHIIRPLKELAGVYSNNAYGSFEVKVINDSLFSFLGKDTMYLRHYSYDIFQSLGYKAGKGADTTSDSPSKILFQMDDNADIVTASMQLDLNDPVIFKKRDKGTQLGKETLARYVGEYTISDMKLKVYLEGEGQLRFFVPGQQLYTLIPQEEHKFKIQELKGYVVEFLVDDKGTVTGLVSVQPNGRFTAKRSQ